MIDEIYGRQAVLNIAYSEVETTSEVMGTLLGVSLQQLDEQWELWISSRYAAIEGAEEMAAEYRREIEGAYICSPGVDF